MSQLISFTVSHSLLFTKNNKLWNGGLYIRWKSKTRVTSSNPRATSSNPRVTSSNPRVTSSNPRELED